MSVVQIAMGEMAPTHKAARLTPRNVIKNGVVAIVIGRSEAGPQATGTHGRAPAIYRDPGVKIIRRPTGRARRARPSVVAVQPPLGSQPGEREITPRTIPAIKRMDDGEGVEGDRSSGRDP